MEKSVALAGVYLLVCLLMHMIASAFSRAQNFGCTFDDNILSSDQISLRGTVDPSSAYRWTGGRIPYFFQEGVTRNDKRVFHAAMKQIENKSCFKFEENRREPREHHLEISVGSPSCAPRFSAFVTIRSLTKVYLESSYQLADSSQCNWEGGILHELMHVLGVSHTQRRKDRDQHITVNWNNIRRKNLEQYKTCEGCNDYGVEYDCASIMHYGTDTFSNGNGPTMSSKSTSCKLSANGPTSASDSDWELLRKVAGTVCSDKPSPRRPVNRPHTRGCRTIAGPSTGSKCVFPFHFAGTTYTECTYTNSDDGRPWCSTKTDRWGRHIGGGGYYGTCASSCPVEKLKDYYDAYYYEEEPTDHYDPYNYVDPYYNDDPYYNNDYSQDGVLEHANSVSLEVSEDALL